MVEPLQEFAQLHPLNTDSAVIVTINTTAHGESGSQKAYLQRLKWYALTGGLSQARAETNSRHGVHGNRAARPCPTSSGSKKQCKLPKWSPGLLVLLYFVADCVTSEPSLASRVPADAISIPASCMRNMTISDVKSSK